MNTGFPSAPANFSEGIVPLWDGASSGTDRTSYVLGGLISAGTSRAIILSGESLVGAPLDETVRAIIQGRTGQALISDHYQSNKIAVIWRANSPYGFVFQFFQYVKSSDTLLINMECSNVAAGCAVYALSAGLATLGAEACLHAINASTGQNIILTPLDLMNPLHTGWNVCFVQNDTRINVFPAQEGQFCSIGGEEATYWAFERGNAFVFALTNPQRASRDLIEELGKLGRNALEAQAADRTKASTPKIILYQVRASEGNTAWLDATCFFGGERHKSLPGSGAMALAGFLTQNSLMTGRPVTPLGEYRFQMRHPSGEISVCTQWMISDDDVQIPAMAFVTEASLLFDGAFYIEDPSRDV